VRIALLAIATFFLAPAIADVSGNKAAVAEAMALLDPARIALDTAYKTHGNAFPSESEFQVSVPSSAQYVKSFVYWRQTPRWASLAVTFRSTSTANLGGILLGVFGKGSETGEVSWTCDAMPSDTAVSPDETANVRSHLPNECRL